MDNHQKILIVDDRVENLIALETALSELNVEFVRATNGNDALAATLKHDFALAILDVMMPEMDGYELAHYLRSDEKTRALPMIFVTASFTDEMHMFKGYEAGGIDYIVKPYIPEILLGKVRIFLELSQHRQKMEQLVIERTDELFKRVGELKCLYEISRLIADSASTIEQVLARTLELLPSSCHNADNAVVKILYDAYEIASPDFKETQWKIREEIIVGGKNRGAIEVCFLQPMAEVDPRQSFIYERDLVENISRQLGVMLERKLVEEALKSSEKKYRRLFEAAKDGILIIEENSGKIIDTNPFMTELTGYPADYFIDRELWDIVTYGDRRLSKTKFDLIREKGYARYEDLLLETSDARRIYVDFISNTYEIDNQRLIQCNIRDITAQRQAKISDILAKDVLALLNRQLSKPETIHAILHLIRERMDIQTVGVRLREDDDYPYYITEGFPEEFVSTERYLCNGGPDGTVSLDSTGNPVLDCMSDTILCGRTDPEQSFFTERGSFWTNRMTELLALTNEADRPSRTRNRCHGEGYESVALIPLRSENMILGLIQLTDRRRDLFSNESIRFLENLADSIGMGLANMKSKEELKESEEKFRALAVNSLDTIMRFDRQHRHLYVNPIVEVKTGIKASDFIGKTHRELGFPEELVVLFEQSIENVFITTNPERVEFKLPSGIWIDWLLFGEISEDGSVSAVIASARDITAIKKAEEEKARLQEQLSQSQKMESIGRLAGGIAHDFNNLLTAIQGYTEIIFDSLKEDDPLRKDLEVIQKATQSATSLTGQLLTFSRKQIVSPKVINLTNTFESSEKMLHRIIGEDIELVFIRDNDISNVLIDPGQVDQILVNLVVNSRDAMPGGGKITLELKNIIIDEKECQSCGNPIIGEYVLLAVSDNGPGISADIIKKIFDPFFTTKELGAGTGLGLSTVQGIVHQNNGHINVYSEPGLGATFKVYLPAIHDEVDVANPVEGQIELHGTETVLVVEDQEIVRNLIVRALSVYGYNIIAAQNGGEALLLCEELEGKIDLLLTDVVMPQMSGKQLYERLLQNKPHLKAIFMSGYTENAIAHHGILDAMVNFIPKPFRAQDLVKRVRQVLNERRPGGTVLLVDDDENIQELFPLYLERMGYEVLVAPDGNTAVELFQNNLSAISLIILDQSLPDTTGDKVLRIIRESNESIPVILTSGYCPDELPNILENGKNVYFLQKPCFRRDFEAAVENTIHKSKA